MNTVRKYAFATGEKRATSVNDTCRTNDTFRWSDGVALLPAFSFVLQSVNSEAVRLSQRDRPFTTAPGSLSRTRVAALRTDYVCNDMELVIRFSFFNGRYLERLLSFRFIPSVMDIMDHLE